MRRYCRRKTMWRLRRMFSNDGLVFIEILFIEAISNVLIGHILLISQGAFECTFSIAELICTEHSHLCISLSLYIFQHKQNKVFFQSYRQLKVCSTYIGPVMYVLLASHCVRLIKRKSSHYCDIHDDAFSLLTKNMCIIKTFLDAINEHTGHTLSIYIALAT